MKLFTLIGYLFRNKEEIERLIEKEVKLREEEIRKSKAHCLNLCYAHRQEENRSHYSEHNCHHCQLLDELSRPTPSEELSNA